LVAADSGLATKVTIAATSSGVAKRLINEVGRAFLKNSSSTVFALLPDLAAQSATKSPTPRERVGPGSTLFTVMPVDIDIEESLPVGVGDVLERPHFEDPEVIDQNVDMRVRLQQFLRD
jgi:hypothetical protein